MKQMNLAIDAQMETARADLTNDLDGVIQNASAAIMVKDDFFMNLQRALDACELAFMVGDELEARAMAKAMYFDLKSLTDALKKTNK